MLKIMNTYLHQMKVKCWMDAELCQFLPHQNQFLSSFQFPPTVDFPSPPSPDVQHVHDKSCVFVHG